jgi:hypothetical protein
VPLFENVGLGISNFSNVTLDDAATTSITDATIIDFTNGTFAPQVALAAMIGDAPNGTWRLEARDYGLSSGSNGQINSWSITISYADPSTTTNASGRYTFGSPFVDATGAPIANLAPSAYFGTYAVRLIVPAGSSLSQPTSPYNLSLKVGQALTAENFGLVSSGHRASGWSGAALNWPSGGDSSRGGVGSDKGTGFVNGYRPRGRPPMGPIGGGPTSGGGFFGILDATDGSQTPNGTTITGRKKAFIRK